MTEKLSDSAKKAQIAENLKRVRENIGNAAVKAGRDPAEITLLAATKTVPPELVNHAVSLGVRAIGENRVQEFLEKAPLLDLDSAEVHFIGHLQTNKAARLIPAVRMIQSVDSMKLAEIIAKASRAAGVVTDVLIEVNIGDEASKSGVKRGEAAELAHAAAELEGIRLRGLMSIPPICGDERQIRNYFSDIHKLFIDIGAKKTDNSNMNVLSMGMSGDYAEAVLEGSTMVRIGSALFGSRAQVTDE